MTIGQAIAYLGGMDERTFKKICPVAPLDMGANILRYSRPQIDAWAATLRPRLARHEQPASDPSRTFEDALESAEDRRRASLERSAAHVRASARKRMRGSQIEPASTLSAYSVAGACRALDIGRTTFYKLVNDGEIQTFKIGAKTLVTSSDLKGLIDRRKELVLK